MISVGGNWGDDCEEALRAMYLFLDGEMSESERAEVRAHLDDCSPCGKAFEFEADLKQIIASRCREDVPAHLYERVRHSLRVEIERVEKVVTTEIKSNQPPKGGIPQH